MKIHIEVISNNCKTKEYIKGVSHKYGTYTKTRDISEAKSYQSPVYVMSDIDAIAYQGQLNGEAFAYVL